jgi:hypothetical protein
MRLFSALACQGEVGNREDREKGRGKREEGRQETGKGKEEKGRRESEDRSLPWSLVCPLTFDLFPVSTGMRSWRGLHLRIHSWRGP